MGTSHHSQRSEHLRPAETTLQAVEILTELRTIDWSFADLLLDRAAAFLSPLCNRERFEEMKRRRELLDEAALHLQRALEVADWDRAQNLASDAKALQALVSDSSRLFGVAASVYQPRPLAGTTSLLALAGIGAVPASRLLSDVTRAVKMFRTLADLDPSLSDLYARRADHYSCLALEDGTTSAVRSGSEDLIPALRAAAETRDFARVASLAKTAAEEHRDVLGRVRAPRPSEAVERRLSAPLPDGAVEAAAQLGLEPVSLCAVPDFNAYLGCSCSERAELLDSELQPGQRPSGTCTCGHPCPPTLRPTLKDNLDLLMGHVFVSGAGARYLPWFGAERLFVETFADASQPASRALLDRLALPARVGVSRVAVDDAIEKGGPGLCREIGLDPLEFRLVCIPFDAFVRLAPERGWATRQHWTHFDGYQVTHELKLLGLVGGDVRYGGADDFCSVGREYQSDRLGLRVAIVRRDRLSARASAQSH